MNILDKELKFIKKFQKVIEKICLKVKLNAEKIYSAFEILMKFYEPPNDYINLYPNSSDLQDFFLKYDHSNNYIALAKFKEIIQILPSSEAGSERFFARMRDTLHKKQTRLSPNSLRSNLILSFNAKQERLSDNEYDYSSDDDYDPHEEEALNDGDLDND